MPDMACCFLLLVRYRRPRFDTRLIHTLLFGRPLWSPNKRQVKMRCKASTPPQGGRKGTPLLYSPVASQARSCIVGACPCGQPRLVTLTPIGRPRGSPLLWTSLASRFVGIVGATLVVALWGGRVSSVHPYQF